MALDSAAEIFSIENFGIHLQSNAEVVQHISADSLQNAFSVYKMHFSVDGVY